MSSVPNGDPPLTLFMCPLLTVAEPVPSTNNDAYSIRHPLPVYVKICSNNSTVSEPFPESLPPLLQPKKMLS